MSQSLPSEPTPNTPLVCRLNHHNERSIKRVPTVVLALLLLCLLFQISYQSLLDQQRSTAQPLTPPPSLHFVKSVAFGDYISASKWLLLWLQSFDHQNGVSLSYHQLDYNLVSDWLKLLNERDSRTQYPLILASRVYGTISDTEKKRVMLNHIHQLYLEAPNQRWRWMAEAALTAKHSLKAVDLALFYASELHEKSTAAHIPFWAKDMKIVLLEDLNELESAKILVGGLLESGQISDPFEITFLEKKLEDLEKKLLHQDNQVHQDNQETQQQ